MTRTIDDLTPDEARELLAAHERVMRAEAAFSISRASLGARGGNETEASALREARKARQELRARLGLDGAT